MPNIDSTWIEIQTGLYLEPHSFTVGGTTYYNSRLHSADGYCFYETALPEEERLYMQYCATPQTDIDEINATFTSVPVEDWMEIVNVPNTPEVI